MSAIKQYVEIAVYGVVGVVGALVGSFLFASVTMSLGLTGPAVELVYGLCLAASIGSWSMVMFS